MTDSASRDPDQLASDLADGLLPSDEAARLRADPEIAARVARIEALRSALRSTPPAPPPAGALDRMVAVAVDAASSAGPAGSSARGSFGPSGSDPRPLQAVRPPVHHAPPTPRARSVRPWLAAAAAVLVGLAMAGLLVRGGSSSDEDMATSAQDSGDQSADDRGEAGGAGSPENEETDEPSATAGPLSPGDEGAGEDTDAGGELGVLSADLGAVASTTELADLVRADRAAGTGEVPTVTSHVEGAACPALQPGGDPARGTATYWAEADYQGRPVTVHVYETGDGARLVATDASCVDVVDVPYQD